MLVSFDLGQLGRDFGVVDLFLHLLDGDHHGTIPLRLFLPAHGGITFTGLDQRYWWWFGFDCAHAGDLVPFYKSIPIPLPGTMVYRDQDYVAGIFTRLAWAISAATELVTCIGDDNGK